jgi:hypothetical protein
MLRSSSPTESDVSLITVILRENCEDRIGGAVFKEIFRLTDSESMQPVDDRTKV